MLFFTVYLSFYITNEYMFKTTFKNKYFLLLIPVAVKTVHAFCGLMKEIKKKFILMMLEMTPSVQCYKNRGLKLF